MARMAAGVRRRPDGTFEKRFTIDNRRISVYGKTAKELVAKEQQIRNKIAEGTYKDNKNITLDEYFEEWLTHKRKSTKANTLKTYKSHYYKHISPVLGKRRVQAIERREIIQLQFKALESLSISTCNMVIKTLKIVLNDAIHDGIIARNPADGVKALKDASEKATETYHRALTEQEQKDFMNEMKNNFYYEFVALLLATGMRIGEAAAITWNDVDYNENVLHITKTVTFDEHGHIMVGDSPKTEAGKRDIPMNDTIRGILKNQKKKTQMLNDFKIIKFDNRVFSTIYGELVNNHAINRAIADTLKKLELKGLKIDHFTAHALRDTFATRYIEQGGNMQTLKTILGHNSLAMTMDLYAHVLPNTKQKEMDNLTIVI